MVCRVSKLKTLGLIGMAVLLLGVCIYGTTLPIQKAQIFGWLGVAFFGLVLILLPFQFFKDAPQIVLDEQGIDDRRSKGGLIRWQDIRAISVGRVKSTRFLCLKLVEPEQYLSRLSSWGRRLASANKSQGLSDVSMSFVGLSPSLDEVLAYIQTISAAKVLVTTSGSR
jgi:hypothetical protein